jgi:hypothetical protein
MAAHRASMASTTTEFISAAFIGGDEGGLLQRVPTEQGTMADGWIPDGSGVGHWLMGQVTEWRKGERVIGGSCPKI